MDCFGKEEVCSYCCHSYHVVSDFASKHILGAQLGEIWAASWGKLTCECGLKPEDDSPGLEGYYYTSDKGAKGRSYQSPGKEPAHGSSSLRGTINISQARCSYDQEAYYLVSLSVHSLIKSQPVHRTKTNLVPSNAVKIRKTKNDAILGDNAVPIEHPKNSAAVTIHIYTLSLVQPHKSIFIIN